VVGLVLARPFALANGAGSARSLYCHCAVARQGLRSENMLDSLAQETDGRILNYRLFMSNPTQADYSFFCEAGLSKLAIPSCRSRSTSELTLTLPQALSHAFSAYNAGRLVEAEQICRQIVNAKHDFFDGLHLLALVQSILGKKEVGLASYDRALSLRPDSAEALSNRGLVLHELRRYEGALASYDRALHLEPDYSEAHFLLGAWRLLRWGSCRKPARPFNRLSPSRLRRSSGGKPPADQSEG
jgi:tetratricopeptide (TPR) repeat protein